VYPSDLSGEQWALVEPLLPEPKVRGRKRSVELRVILNAILYVLKGGISWRMLPKEFARWKTVYHYFRLWRITGLWDRIHDHLREQVRQQHGRERSPSAAVLDSQSIASTQKGGLAATMLPNAPRAVNGILS
jgi:putative transposase